MRLAAFALALALAAALVALPGCGTADPPAPDQQVRETLGRFGHAVSTKDYTTLCQRLFAPALLAQLAKLDLPCELAMQRSFADVRRPTLVVRSVRVQGDQASAIVRSAADNQRPSDDTVKLVRRPDGWRIVALASPSRP